MSLGTAIHMAVLQPDDFDKTYAAAGKFDRRTKVGKEAAEKWATENVGKIGLENDDFDRILRVHSIMTTDPLISQFISGGVAEASWFATDPITGVQVKGRTDYWHPEKRVIVDIKTCDNAHESIFPMDARKYFYHVQMAFYSDLIEWRTGEKVEGCILLAVEKDGEADVIPYVLAGREMDVGRALYRRWLNMFAECVQDDKWPGYERKLTPIRFPDWYLDTQTEMEF